MTPVVQVQENLKILPQALNFTVCKGATRFWCFLWWMCGLLFAADFSAGEGSTT